MKTLMDQYNKLREKRKTKTKDAAVGFASWPLEINTGILTWHGIIFNYNLKTTAVSCFQT